MKKGELDVTKLVGGVCAIICVFSLLIAVSYAVPGSPLMSVVSVGPIKIEGTSPEFDKAAIALAVALGSGFISVGFLTGKFPGL